ncbi:MAG: DUF3102 domain-containing protein [Alphaproteobacteria bacterium]
MSTLPTEFIPDIAEKINEAHGRLIKGVRTTVNVAIEVGVLLNLAKGRIPQGHWEEWIGANCTFSLRSAQGYMRLARERAKIEQDAEAQPVALLGLRDALTALADNSRQSTPGETGSPPPPEPTANIGKPKSEPGVTILPPARPDMADQARDWTPPDGFQQATTALGHLRTFATFCQQNTPETISGGVLDHEADDMRNQVAAISDWIARFAVSLEDAA